MIIPDSKQALVVWLRHLYDNQGLAPYGECISQRDHALQCASLARDAGSDGNLIVAALLHDIGHLLEDIDGRVMNRHDSYGADILSRWFNEGVTEPVRLHAQAKRYLCTVEPSYQQGLSEASRISLQHQGGLMSEQELRAYESNPASEAATRLRRWDDAAKDIQWSGGCFSEWTGYIEEALGAARA